MSSPQAGFYALAATGISLAELQDRQTLAQLPASEHDWYRQNMALARQKPPPMSAMWTVAAPARGRRWGSARDIRAALRGTGKS